jgi:hypothetical protein
VAVDLAKMVEEFYDYFLGLYHQKRGEEQQHTDLAAAAGSEPASAADAFLAFAGIGTAITPGMFQLTDGSFYTPLVTEQFSLLANDLPKLDGATIATSGLARADEEYGLLLAQAQPLKPEDMQALGAIKGPAEKNFAAAMEEPRTFGGVPYHPALPTPPDWPLPSGDSAWVTREFKQTETTVVSRPPVPAPAPLPRPAVPRPQMAWRWRVAPAELSGAVKSVDAMQAAVAPRAVAATLLKPAASMAMMRAPMLSKEMAASPARMVAPAVRTTATAPVAMMARRVEFESPPIIPVIERADMLQLRLQELRERSQPQSVTSRSLTLSFQYCLVTARRLWLSGAFLNARNWYVPGRHAGEIASGTGTGDGSLEVIPTAALCVRNLTIKAEWSAEETAALANFVKLGPFSLVGREIHAESNTMTCPVTQIIGWVMEPLPRLPPNSDPALP